MRQAHNYPAYATAPADGIRQRQVVSTVQQFYGPLLHPIPSLKEPFQPQFSASARMAAPLMAGEVAGQSNREISATRYLTILYISRVWLSGYTQ